jgi:DNA-binding NarL/FixJ family response regulator
VDDNPDVVEALRLLTSRERGYEWAGSLESADMLISAARTQNPDVILLDVDMPVAIRSRWSWIWWHSVRIRAC